MTTQRLLYGLDRIPGTLSSDDPRLPAAALTPTPLRLNSFPLPPDAWGSGAANHPARMEAVQTWLLTSCGDYNAALRRAVTRYLDAIEAHIAHHRDTLTAALAPFHGLYQPEDWCWSALRPLPRAWWRHQNTWARADLAFWDGNTVIAMGARDFDAADLPAAFQHFWIGQTLPVSPFRRAFPDLRPSSP